MAAYEIGQSVRQKGKKINNHNEKHLREWEKLLSFLKLAGLISRILHGLVCLFIAGFEESYKFLRW